MHKLVKNGHREENEEQEKVAKGKLLAVHREEAVV